MRRPDTPASPTILAPGAPVLGLGLVAAVALVYLPALRGGFVFDDVPLIAENAALTSGSLWALLLQRWPPDDTPLVFATWWVEWRLWGADPLGFHAVNVALHALTALLLWRVLHRLGVPGAWLGALLFGLHPVAVESAAWISEGKNTLSGALFLATALLWLDAEGLGASTGGAPEPTWRRAPYAASLMVFVLALGAKASVVMLPVALAAVTLLRGGRNRPRLARLLPYFALSLLAGGLTVWHHTQYAFGDAGAPSRGLGERLGGAGWALLTYQQTALAPVGLGFVYAEWPIARTSPMFFAPLAATLALAATLLLLRARPWAAWLLRALGYHALLVAPVLGLFSMSYFGVGPISNHLQYLALMGPAGLGGAMVARIAVVRPTWARLVGAALALTFGAITFQRAQAFQSDVTLWQHAVREAPRSVFASKQLALSLLEAGRTTEGLAALERLGSRTDAPFEAARARSMAAMLQGRYDEAVRHALDAQRLTPDRAFARDLGRGLVKARRPELAVVTLEPLVQSDPRDAEARYWLGSAWVAQKQCARAEAVLSDGLLLLPKNDRLREALSHVRGLLDGPACHP